LQKKSEKLCVDWWWTHVVDIVSKVNPDLDLFKTRFLNSLVQNFNMSTIFLYVFIEIWNWVELCVKLTDPAVETRGVKCSWFWQILKVRETQEGGWIVFSFSLFSPTEVIDQKQIEFSFWCDNQNLNAADKNRERERERERERTRKDTKQLYRFLPQIGSSHFPLALPRRVHQNVISDYNCSLLQLARDFKLLKHNCKRFPMLKNTIKRLSMLYAHAQLQETSIQTELQRNLFEVEHLIYNQWCSQYKSDTGS